MEQDDAWNTENGTATDRTTVAAAGVVLLVVASIASVSARSAWPPRIRLTREPTKLSDHRQVKLAAYQAPLLTTDPMCALDRIRARVRACEAEGVAILCCPEAILGGLADQSAHPARLAISARTGQLDAMLAPLRSGVTTTIVGFTELGDDGHFYNAAAVFHRGIVSGIYRKMHPAIRRSVYHAGCHASVFRAGSLLFGIAICNDSNFPELVSQMAARGATALFVPTNNALPHHKRAPEIVTEARRVDVATAIAHRMWVVRADVAGQTPELSSLGSSAIVDPHGTIVRSALPFSEDLIATAIEEISQIPGG